MTRLAVIGDFPVMLYTNGKVNMMGCSGSETACKARKAELRISLTKRWQKVVNT